MDSHRIEGIKYDFDRLTDDELTGIRGHLLTTHQRVTDEIGLIERTLFERTHDQLPLESGRDNYERVLGRAVLAGEIDCTEASQALGRYDG
jgi:hypothetical protein